MNCWLVTWCAAPLVGLCAALASAGLALAESPMRPPGMGWRGQSPPAPVAGQQTAPREQPEAPAPKRAEPSARPGVNTHDGFWFEVQFGQGYMQYLTTGAVTRDDRRGRLRAAGLGGHGAVTLGGAITREWSLGVSLDVATVVDPSITLGGQYLDADHGYSSVGLAALLRYYLPFWHLAVTAGVGFGTAGDGSDEADTLSEEGERGFYPDWDGTGLHLQLGVMKLWWISENWSIGGQSRVFFVSGSTFESDARAWGLGVSMVFAYQ